MRGGNGVIIITTKPGIVSKPKFTVDFYQGLTQLTKIPDLVGGIEYMNAVNEAYQHSRGRAYYSDQYIMNTKIANNMPLNAEEQAYAQTVAGNPTINKYLYPNVNMDGTAASMSTYAVARPMPLIIYRCRIIMRKA